MRSIAVIALALSLTGGLAGALQAQTPTPEGVWRTFDDKTGQERGLVRIREQQGELVGFIIGTKDPAEATRTCDLCEGDRKGKPIMGLNVINGLRRDGDVWEGGRILEPETGSIYRCTMRLIEGGRKLVVRGYLGVSLFGRSQTWLRAP